MMVACLTVGALPCTAQSASTRNAQVERVFALMTPREKIAQLVIPWIAGTYMADDDPTFTKIVSWVDSLKVGGLIVSIGSPLDIAAKLKTASKGHMTVATFEERLYGVPLYADVSALFYNKDLFTRAGLDPNNMVLPSAHDELVAELAREVAPPQHVLDRVGSVSPAETHFFSDEMS